MNKIKLDYVLVTLAIFILQSLNLQAKWWDKLPVLVYHHLQNNVQSDVSCTPEQFKSQMKALKSKGYTPITLKRFRKYLMGGLDDIARPVLITFDDGYESVYQYAFPIIREMKMPIIIFVVTSRIGKKPQFSSYMTRKQIREMSDSGFVEFGSHTHDLHTDSLRIYNAFLNKNNNPVKLLLKRDLDLSRKTLKNITGFAPISIAWPYGKYNSAFSQIAREIGFKLHFTSGYGYNEIGLNPYSIKRIPVSSRDTALSVLKKLSGK